MWTLLLFAVVDLCVDAVVAVHFDFNRIRLERLFPIFFLQRKLPVVNKKEQARREHRKSFARFTSMPGKNFEHTHTCEQAQTCEWPSGGCLCMKQAHTKIISTESLHEPASNHLLVLESVVPVGINKAGFISLIFKWKGSERKQSLCTVLTEQIVHVRAALWPGWPHRPKGTKSHEQTLLGTVLLRWILRGKILV